MTRFGNRIQKNRGIINTFDTDGTNGQPIESVSIKKIIKASESLSIKNIIAAGLKLLEDMHMSTSLSKVTGRNHQRPG